MFFSISSWPALLSPIVEKTFPSSVSWIEKLGGLSPDYNCYINVKDIDERWILIKVNDNGSGIDMNDIKKIWYYSYTTHPMNTDNMIEQNDFSVNSPLSGFGYGLPISEIYINFLNSSPHNIKICSDEKGTCVYIYLRKYEI